MILVKSMVLAKPNYKSRVVFKLNANRLITAVILSALLMMTSISQAKEMLTIVISKGSDNPTSVAVVPFGWDSFKVLPVDVADLIGENLKLSGLFDPFDPKDMISQPHERADVLVRDWKRLGVQYLVIGRIEQKVDMRTKYQVVFELFDISNGKNLVSKQVSGNHLDKIANKVSDHVYQALTGVPGFFSTKLAYLTTQWTSETERTYRLQEADANGRTLKTILTSKQPIMSPSWSPNGEKLAYVSFQKDRPNIFIQDRRTGKQTLLTSFPGINGAPDWSPDGKKIAMVLSKDGNPEIYVMHLRTKQLERLTNHYAIDTEPRWAPDGLSIVFTSNRGGAPQIYQLNIADKKVKRLTFEGKYNARGQLTPDGKHLVFVHRDNKEFHIAAQNIERGFMTKLTKTALDESPSIAPNGSMIVYATQSEGKSVLRMVTIDGNIEMEVPAAQGELREPSWSPFLK